MSQYFPKLKGHDNANCSTIIVGKNASKTGHVLLGHNEDDRDCYVQVHKVPRRQHPEGEMLSYADVDAVIEQVSETYAYQWSETRSAQGESFADSFVNEWGVAVVTNSCVSTKVNADNVPKAGIGYGLRSLIAERAKTAREGVAVAAQLIEKYGYVSSRAYQICDKDEGWSVQIGIGHRIVARRIGDDEIYYIPNWFTIHQIDFNDKENFYASPDLIDYAIENGFYKPAKAGDYSDFDFTEVYQGEGSEVPSNILRSRQAWGVISGGEFNERRVFSIKAQKKYGVEDLKEVLRTHYKESKEDLESGAANTPHRFSVCNARTIESLVVEFAQEADLTCVWRTCPRPCSNPYMPWYVGATRLPDGYEWIGPDASKISHFACDKSELVYNPKFAYWAFKQLQALTDFDYLFCHKILQPEIEAMEARWTATKPAIDKAYLELAKVSKEYAQEFLTDYTAAQAQYTWDWANRMFTVITEAQWTKNEETWRSNFKWEE